jgi:hypothetical protein
MNIFDPPSSARLTLWTSDSPEDPNEDVGITPQEADDHDRAALSIPLNRRFYSYHEAGLIFGRSARTIRWWVRLGHLDANRMGRARLIPLAEILRLSEGAQTPVTTNSATHAPETALRRKR